MFDLKWDKDVTYGQLRHPWEVEYSTYHFEQLDAEIALRSFRHATRSECKRLLARAALVLPAYDFCMKCSHAFNSLDARGAISVTERQRFIGRVRGMARRAPRTYVADARAARLPAAAERSCGAQAVAAFDARRRGRRQRRRARRGARRRAACRGDAPCRLTCCSRSAARRFPAKMLARRSPSCRRSSSSGSPRRGSSARACARSARRAGSR